MIITSNQASQTLRILARERYLDFDTSVEPNKLPAGQVAIELYEDGTGLKIEVDNEDSLRYDNYLELKFNVNDYLRESYYYRLDVYTKELQNAYGLGEEKPKLIYRDKIFVLPANKSPYDEKERYTLNDSYTQMEDDVPSSYDYIVFDEGSDYDYATPNTDGTPSTVVNQQSNTSSGGQSITPLTGTHDIDNDGYGEVYAVSFQLYVYGVGSGPFHNTSGQDIDGNTVNYTTRTNLVGEYTVDESQYGTFQTAAGYTEYIVHHQNIRQPSDIGTQSYYSQTGLADYMNGYVRYSEGYDYKIAQHGNAYDVLDLLVESNANFTVPSGATIEDLMSDENQFNPDFNVDDTRWDRVKIYLDSSKTDIAVGDSIYADDQGSKYPGGSTNGRTNRAWFNWNGDVVKVTGGVVTHRYNYKDGPERFIMYVGTNTMKKREWDGSNYLPEVTHVLPSVGKEWEGDGPGGANPGSLVTKNVIADVAAEAQTQLDAGLSNIETFYSSAQTQRIFLDWGNYVPGTGNYPFEPGEFVYRRRHGKNGYRRLDLDMEKRTRQLVFTINNPITGTPVTIDNSYKAGETFFGYLPVFGNMPLHFDFQVNKSLIIVEYDKYTGEIINRQIVSKSNY